MIYIFRGDSTVFADILKFLTFRVNTNLDLTGWTAELRLGNITKQVQDISKKVFEVILKASETTTLPLGNVNGVLRLFDNKGHVKTISNNIAFCVTNNPFVNKHESMSVSIPKMGDTTIDLEIGTGYVTEVNGKTGAVTLTLEDIGGVPRLVELEGPDILLETIQPFCHYRLGEISSLVIMNVQDTPLTTTIYLSTGTSECELILPENTWKINVPRILSPLSNYLITISNSIVKLEKLSKDYVV